MATLIPFKVKEQGKYSRLRRGGYLHWLRGARAAACPNASTHVVRERQGIYHYAAAAAGRRCGLRAGKFPGDGG